MTLNEKMAKITATMMKRCCPFKTCGLEWLTSFWNQCGNVCMKLLKLPAYLLKANTVCIKPLRIKHYRGLETTLCRNISIIYGDMCTL